MTENSTMAAAKKHIEEIRKERFWIGVGKNPLSKPLRMAVKYLSAELYSKDIHFLMELIQNAEDNEYGEGVEPCLEFMVTCRDITGTGAPATLLIFNNEKGFSRRNIESICSVGDSTKAGNRKRGYIGEKGIGFKSVFLLTAQPYIFSNGYQICFSETPCPECDIAYIVPEWVDNNVSISDVQKIYGCDRTLPTTTLILPLKPDKVKVVKDQLSSLHPELLLFLSKIKRLSVKEDNADPTIRAVSITSERDFVAKKDLNAESYTIHLTAEEDSDDREGECRYYMWRQRFPVKKENKVEKRNDIEEWAITLAFPYGKRLNRGTSSAGIYAFLPTEILTNFPFIIQADFLLPSSRETILWDDKWNQGILDCVPTAFINAFVSLVRNAQDAPASSLASMLAFLPVSVSSHSKLNLIRESIREKLREESIILSESHSISQKFFHKPNEVCRLMQSFWNILLKAKQQGAKLHQLAFQGKHILHSSFDTDKYNDALNFLGIKFVDLEWYSKCIPSCNIVMGVSEDIYVELLQFLAENWRSHFDKTTVNSIPLLKYVCASGDVSLISINETTNQSNKPFLLCSQEASDISWLIDWSKEFISASQLAFLPKKTQECCSRVDIVSIWLKNHVNVKTISVYEYASRLQGSLRDNRSLVLAFAHFLHHSFSKGFMYESEVKSICTQMPLVNSYGGVSVTRNGVLVPANGSNWVDLMGSNPWGVQNFVELAADYLQSGRYAGHFTPDKALIKFLRRFAGASDIPDISPPDAAFPTVSGPLTKQNVFLLLDWIRKLRCRGISMPETFLSCIKNGSWLRVTISGCPAYKPPSQSFVPSSSWGNLLQNGSDMVDIPLVDQVFYDRKIDHYQEELKAMGVMFEFGQACVFIGERLMSMATEYNLTRTKVIAMLSFIRFLRGKRLSVADFVDSVKNVKWLKTSCGYRSPVETVLYDESWEAASGISQIPFIDRDYYGKDILDYKTELELLGVKVGFNGNYQIVMDHVKSAAGFNCLMPKSLIFALKCICNYSSAEKLVKLLKEARCLKANNGYLSPDQCFLFDHGWGCIIQVFECFPCIDGHFYGSDILQYKDALRKIGVVVDFDAAIEKFISVFKQRASANSFPKENALSFIKSYRDLMNARQTLPADFRACIQESRWLRTRLGDCRSPKDCILFSSDWQPISQITLLPFVDDRVNCYGKGIHDYRNELKSMGVVVDFSKGSRFVLSHIYFPHDPSHIYPSSIISLLKGIRNFKPNGQKSFPEDFLKQIHHTKWLKTTVGYMSPQECLLFDPMQRPLQRSDGPFIDEEYYGSLSSYKEELAAVGVVVNMRSSDANSLLSHHIKLLTEFDKIVRIYDFLSGNNWEPGDGPDKRIWLPTSSGWDGMWVSPNDCVLDDHSGLFSSRLHVLDQKNYNSKLLSFFSKAYEVRSTPSADDFCKLWIEWENSRHVISLDECSAFWRHVIGRWSSKNEKMIADSVTRIPAASGGSGDVVLVDKRDVFIPDDLLLKDLFEKSTPNTLFVWFPKKQISSNSCRILRDIYSKIGVKKFSESVSMSEQSDLDRLELKQVNREDVFIGKGLLMIIMGFFADPEVNIEVQRRHETVKTLLNVSVFETAKPITMRCSLKMTSGDIVKGQTSQMVRWERESSKFFTQKLDRSGARKNVVEYATKFSEVVAEGLLWEDDDQVPRLSDLIKFGFLMDFDEDAVAYFMKSKNLQIFAEDEEFLASIFSSS